MKEDLNDWFELDLDTDIIFSDNYKNKWNKAISKLGINKEYQNFYDETH